jgi:MFS family permease
MQVEEDFHVGQVVAILGLSTFVFGLAIGPLFMGPLSEFYGRKPVYIVSYFFFISTVLS